MPDRKEFSLNFERAAGIIGASVVEEASEGESKVSLTMPKIATLYVDGDNLGLKSPKFHLLTPTRGLNVTYGRYSVNFTGEIDNTWRNFSVDDNGIFVIYNEGMPRPLEVEKIDETPKFDQRRAATILNAEVKDYPHPVYGSGISLITPNKRELNVFDGAIGVAGSLVRAVTTRDAIEIGYWPEAMRFSTGRRRSDGASFHIGERFVDVSYASRR